MVCLKRKAKGFTFIELIIVIAVIAIMAAVLAPSFSRMFRDSRIEAANKNAQLVLMSLQNRIAKFDYQNVALTDVSYAAGFYDSASGTVTEEIRDSTDTVLSAFPINLSNSLSEEIRQGSWIAKINPEAYTVECVVWSEQPVDFDYGYINLGDSFSTIDALDEYIVNHDYDIYGCYPIGS